MWGTIVVAAVTALAQWMNSESARKASAEERKRIQALYEKLQLPNTKPEDLTPDEYSVIGTYAPDVAPYIAEVAPTTIEQTDNMRQGTQAQQDALEQMRQAARMERDPALMAQLEQASARSAATAAQQREAVLSQMQRRGQMGSGMELAAQIGGQAQGMARGAEEGRAAAIEAYRNRMLAGKNAADIGSGLYSQEEGTQSKNAAIINAFNQRNATAQQGFLNNRADILNQAQKYNLGNAQDIANKNIAGKNVHKGQIADLEQQKFQNARGIAGDLAGLGRDRIGDIRSDAQDKNQAIQGVGNSVASGMKYNQSSDQYKDAQDSENRRAIYYKTGKWMTPDEYDAWQTDQEQNPPVNSHDSANEPAQTYRQRYGYRG